MHDTPLIATIVVGLGLAFILGTLANRLRLPPLAGYLCAGILVGPYTPGFVADQALAPELAEMGVILLMFGVGLHFSLKDLLSVRAIAVPGAVVQIVAATAMGAGLAWFLGWPLGAGLVFGLALSVASTVVLLRALQERRLIDTDRGRIAIGWLIVEDLVMILTLVLLPALAGLLGGHDNTAYSHGAYSGGHNDLITSWLGSSLWGVLLVTLAKIAAFLAIMLIIGRRIIPWILHYIAHTGSRELFRLAVLSIALGVAFGAAKLFGVSLALGAFFAGMVLSESELSHRAAEESLPLRDAFAVLFFVSVGMLFDPMSLINDPLPVAATLFIILIGKSVAAYIIVRVFRHPAATALTISASLAQVGEFSFILAELGVRLGLLPEQGRNLIFAGAILSILLNPASFFLASRLKKWMTSGMATAERSLLPMANAAPITAATPPRVEEEPVVTTLQNHIVLAGYGRVGRLISEGLQQDGIPFLVLEDADKTVARLRADGIETIAGNAARPDVLKAANLPQARSLVIAIPNTFEAGQIAQQARAANPRLCIIAWAHSDAEAAHLKNLGADTVLMGEREIADGILQQIHATSALPA